MSAPFARIAPFGVFAEEEILSSLKVNIDGRLPNFYELCRGHVCRVFDVVHASAPENSIDYRF